MFDYEWQPVLDYVCKYYVFVPPVQDEFYVRNDNQNVRPLTHIWSCWAINVGCGIIASSIVLSRRSDCGHYTFGVSVVECAIKWQMNIRGRFRMINAIVCKRKCAPPQI